jgi:outer membrane protein assembly factor BamB
MGQQLWSFPLLGQNYYTTPLIDAKQNLYVSPNSSSLLYSISTSKTVKWSIDMEGFDFKSFNISKDGSVLYTIAFSEEIPNQEVGHLFALSTNDGQVLWKFENSEKQGVYGEPTIGPDQTIYCTSYIGNKIFAVNPDGTSKWTFTLPAAQDGYLSTSSPSVDSDGNIYFNHFDCFICINKEGTLKWRFDKIDAYAYMHTPTIGSDGTIFSLELLNGRINLVAFDASGQLKWRTEPDESTGSIYCSPVVDSEGTVYLGLGPAYHENSINFIAINSDGTIKYKMALPADDGQISDISLPPSISENGIAYIGIERPMGNFLYAIK